MKKQYTFKRQEAIQGVLSILPVVVIILLIRAYPIVTTIFESFTNWNGLSRNDWVGLNNYISIFSGTDFWILLRNNLILLLNVPLQVFVGLVVAVLLYEEVPGWRIFRSIYYLPQIISAVIIGFLFRIFFSYNGPLNIILRSMGLDSAAIEWLGNGSTAIGVIITCLVWINIGWQGILIQGGMSSIPPSIFEAAKIDGANYWQRTFLVVFPMLTRVMEYSFIISTVWTFTSLFPFIYSMTNGGPGYQTTTIDYMIYIKAFVSGNQLGVACALAVILLIIVLIFTRLQMALANKADDWSE